jgi:hypothetical protein
MTINELKKPLQLILYLAYFHLYPFAVVVSWKIYLKILSCLSAINFHHIKQYRYIFYYQRVSIRSRHKLMLRLSRKKLYSTCSDTGVKFVIVGSYEDYF